MDWVTELYEAELSSEVTKKRDQDREEFRVYLLERGSSPALAAEPAKTRD